MSNKADISFIICTYNRAHYLQETLQSLVDNKADQRRFELLVIDNNSSDDTPSITEEYIEEFSAHNIRYIKEYKQGLSHARNRGIKEADNPIVIFLDDDILTDNDFISNWLNFFDEHPSARCAGGKIEVQFDDPRPNWMSHFLLPLLGHHNLGNSIKKYGTQNYPFGGNMGFQQSIFDEYGLFDTDLGRKGKKLKASEEKDLFQRIKNDGIDIFYVPKAKLYHRVNSERLTKDYIKRQALGLGQSIALQLREKPLKPKLQKASEEMFKLMVTLGLFLPYTLSFQWPKAIMLIKFRKWILEGYLSVDT